jgi:hypothetical protein
MENGNNTSLQTVSRSISNIKLLKGNYSRETQTLIEDIRSTIEKIETIRSQYDTISDADLIDYAIYREKAEQKRLSYLLGLAKACPELTNIIL